MVFKMCFPKVGGSNALARATSEERKKNQEIDKLIRRDKKANAKQVKILLLGQSQHCCPHRSNVSPSRVLLSDSFLCRRRRVRQIDNPEADANNLLRGLPSRRAQGSPSGHIFQYDSRIQNYCRGDARPRNQLRG